MLGNSSGDLSLYRDSNEFVPYRLVKRALDTKLLVLRDAIHNFLQTRADATVIDVGTGGGLLASWAVECKTVSEVIAIEDDPLMLVQTHKALAGHPNRKRISILDVENLLTCILPKKCDLLLCDVLSTALIEQPQAPLLNHYLQFLKPTGLVLPDGLTNMVTLLDFDFTFCDSLIRLPAIFDASSAHLPNGIFITEPILLNQVSFRETVPDHVSASIQLPANSTGWVRAVQLQSQICVVDKKIDDPNSICHPLIIPLNKELFVEQGQLLDVSLKINHRSVDNWGRATAGALPSELDICVSLFPF